MNPDISISIPSHLLKRCGRNLHWDFYRVDVRLKSGKVIRGLSVHSAKAFVPASGEDGGKYDFESSDIENIRPATFVSRLKTLLCGW